MTIPAMAPPETVDGDEVSVSEAWRSGATIGVEVTVWVTGSPEMVTTRVLVTGEGVADSGIEELEVGVVSSSTIDDEEVLVSGGGVELELEAVRVRDEDYEDKNGQHVII